MNPQQPPAQQQPTQQPTPSQVSAGWGDPNKVQQFRTQALQQGMGIKQVDDYIAQMQGAYQSQAGHQVQNVIGANQGGITPNQAKEDPTAALSFLNGGGKLINSGPDAQAKIINDAGSYFAKRGNKQGYVNPQDYNNALGSYVQAGGNSTDFEGKFSQSYVDPKNAFYNTPDAKAARSALPVIKNVVDSYFNLPVKGPEFTALSSIPVVGQLLQQGFLAKDAAHNEFLNGQIGNIRQIAGAGANQGFRFNLNELNNIAGLLPSANDSQQKANAKLDNLDKFLKTNMGTDLKTILKGGQ